MSATRQLDMPAWDCLQLLRSHSIGRLCVTTAGYPVAFPVNYRLAEPAGTSAAVVIRTRPDGVLARAAGAASLELDEIDAAAGRAWSVIVRGSLGPVTDLADLPVPQPWLADGRHLWLALPVQSVSGRRFVRVDDADHGADWEFVAG